MSQQKIFFGTSKQLLDKIDSLDQKWYVEIWEIKYYFLGIEIHSRKKEKIKHTHENLDHSRIAH